MEKNMVNIALLQMISCKTQKENLEKGIEYCRRAKMLGADIALFPEMWNCGYNLKDNAEFIKAQAVDADGEFVCTFKSLAAELNMAIAVTFLERFEPAPKNSVILFDRHGNKALHYSKVHTCDFGDEKHLTPGDDFYVTDLETAAGSIKIGAMICYDREHPESARILMLKGAEIILVPNACPMEINRLSQLRSRAFENMLGIAMANYAYPQPDCNGHSSAFDGIAYRADSPVSRDTLIIEAGENEGIYIAAFPIDEMREYRLHEALGNAYRRPHLYSELISDNVNDPFIRNDRRK